MTKLIEVIVRAALQAVSGAIITKGVNISDSNIDQLVGAVTLIITVVWSIWSKTKANEKSPRTSDSTGSRV